MVRNKLYFHFACPIFGPALTMSLSGCSASWTSTFTKLDRQPACPVTLIRFDCKGLLQASLAQRFGQVVAADDEDRGGQLQAESLPGGVGTEPGPEPVRGGDPRKGRCKNPPLEWLIAN